MRFRGLLSASCAAHGQDGKCYGQILSGSLWCLPCCQHWAAPYSRPPVAPGTACAPHKGNIRIPSWLT